MDRRRAYHTRHDPMRHCDGAGGDLRPRAASARARARDRRRPHDAPHDRRRRDRTRRRSGRVRRVGAVHCQQRARIVVVRRAVERPFDPSRASGSSRAESRDDFAQGEGRDGRQGRFRRQGVYADPARAAPAVVARWLRADVSRRVRWSPQVFATSPSGGASRALTSAPQGVITYEWAPDGKSLAYLTREPAPTSLVTQVDAPQPATRLWRQPLDDVTADSRLPTADPQALTPAAYHVDSFSWLPNGREIVYSATTPRRTTRASIASPPAALRLRSGQAVSRERSSIVRA